MAAPALNRHAAALWGAMSARIGRIPMVRLVALSLGLLIGYSLILSQAGLLEFDPLSLLRHLLLALAAVTVPGWLCSLLVRAPLYWESSLVTGGLLYFLFWPAESGSETAGVILAGVFAALSKYLLTWRGRHIFNPAALGAFAASLTGLNAATWWIGTPSMLWLVLPLGLLVLFRASQFSVALTFLLALAATTAAVASSSTQGLQAAFTSLFFSQATLFFAAFMLSEPLTLPPRRWQRAVVGAAAGVLFAIPFSLEVGQLLLSNAPELILLLANVVAFALRPKFRSRLIFQSQRSIGTELKEYTFSCPGGVPVQAGQYVELSIPGPGRAALRRTFSPVSGSGEQLSIATTVAEPTSAAKKSLNALTPGARLHVAAAGGDFVLPRHDAGAQPLLLVAGGIGITALLALARQAREVEADVVILYSARSVDRAPYLAELVASGARVLLRTTEEVPEGAAVPAAVELLGPEHFSTARLQSLVPDLSGRRAYLAGSAPFVSQLRGQLRRAGVRSVKTDAFLGY